MKALTECKHCGREIDLGEIQKPRTVDFIKIVCSGCGESQQTSLLRMYQRARIRKKIKKSD